MAHRGRETERQTDTETSLGIVVETMARRPIATVAHRVATDYSKNQNRKMADCPSYAY